MFNDPKDDNYISRISKDLDQVQKWSLLTGNIYYIIEIRKISSMIFPHFHPPNFLNSSMQNTHHLGQGDRQLTTYKNVMISNIENRY